tara:strand:- start:527 stop:844 length:318 start_codon:yes stop_codon:yes gene_type:complete
MKRAELTKLVKEGLWANINAKKKAGKKSSHGNSKAHKAAKKAGNALEKTKNETNEGDHKPMNPGILKKRLGELSCTKVKTAKGKLKDKGTTYAKALQRYLNYHCQ